MIISILEASNYFKGLLLLARKDNKISHEEQQIILRIGKQLGFEKEFCETTILDVLENTYIEDDPIEFSSKELAEKFLKDGVVIAASGKELHQHEEQWLAAVAEKNRIERDWFEQTKMELLNRNRKGFLLEADSLATQHTLNI